MAEPSATIAICSRDRAHFLGEALEAMRGQLDELEAAGFAPARLLVIDNGSSDGTPNLLRELAAREPRLGHVREEAAGLYFARARALRESAGPWLLFADDDILPDPGWAVGLVRALAADPALGAVGASVRPLWMTEEPPWLTRRLRDLMVLIEASGPPGAVEILVPPRTPVTTGMALRRRPCLALFDAPERRANPLGYGASNDPRLPPVSGEDNDLALILAADGLKLGMVAGPGIRHRILPAMVTERYYRDRALKEGHLRVRLNRLAGLSPLARGAWRLALAAGPLAVLDRALGPRLGDPGRRLTLAARAETCRGVWREWRLGRRDLRYPYRAAGS